MRVAFSFALEEFLEKKDTNPEGEREKAKKCLIGEPAVASRVRNFGATLTFHAALEVVEAPDIVEIVAAAAQMWA